MTLNVLDSFWNVSSNIKSNFKFDYSKFDFSNIQHVLKQFRTPLKENGAQAICDKVFPEFKGRITRESIPTHSEVASFDAYELETYCKVKRVNKNFIDQYVLDKVFNYTTSLFNSTFPYYNIRNNKDCLIELPHDTSSCYPRFMKKGNDINVIETLKEMKYFDSLRRRDLKMAYLYQFPTTIFHRFTPKMKVNETSGNCHVSYKIRQIFGVSHFICALEVKYLTYFVNNFKRSMKDICTIGLTRPEVSKLIGLIRIKATKTDRVVMCGDIKGCDKSVTTHFFRVFFDSLSNFAPNVFVKDAILSIGNYMASTPVLRENEIKITNGSTVSGSWITSVFNTFVVYSVLCYCYFVLYNRFPLVHEILVQGDDFVLVIDDGDEGLIQEMFFYFNLRLKLESTLIAREFDNIEFLGFKWDFHNTPGQDNSWIYVRTVFPEKRCALSGPDRVISRYLSLIFQCNNGSMLFKRFLRYDKVLYDKVLTTTNPTFYLIDNSGKVNEMVFPIQYFLNVGWKAF